MYLRFIIILAFLMINTQGWAGSYLFEHHSTRFRVGPNVTSIVAVDMNDDGLPEIITSDRGRMYDPREERPAQDLLSYLTAQKALEYTPRPQLLSGFGPYCIVVANLDALKAPDLVVANFLATRHRDLTLLRNIGPHLFESLHFTVNDEAIRYTKMRDGDDTPIFTTPGLTSLAVFDVDSDGYRDVVATAWSSDVLLYFPGVEQEFLGTPQIIAAKGGPRDIEMADFNKDGHIDLAVTLYSTNEVGLWEGDGAGGFVETARFASRGLLPHKLEVADVNGDDYLDIIVSHCHGDDSIVIFYGNGGFKFDVSQEIMLGKVRGKIEREIRDIVVSDLDQDGKPDLAAACYASNEVVVLRNRSKDERLPQIFDRETYDFNSGKPRALCVSDFNSDGKRDLGVALWGTDSVALLLGR